MPWSFFNNTDTEELKAFISSREHSCMNFASELKKKLSGGLKYSLQLNNQNSIVLHRNRHSRDIDFTVMLSPTGQLLPAADTKKTGTAAVDISEGIKLFKDAIFKVNTVMGDKLSVNKIIENCFSEKSIIQGTNSFNYYSMVLSRNNFNSYSSLPPGIIIRDASQSDLADLMSLQMNYEIEEVLPEAEMYSSYASRKMLISILREQRTVIAEKSGEIVAKANTNASGFRHFQIGGVYTLPGYRRQGISTAVVSALSDRIFKSGMNLSLFVKTGNNAAVKVYIKLGFEIVEEFQITYLM